MHPVLDSLEELPLESRQRVVGFFAVEVAHRSIIAQEPAAGENLAGVPH